MNIGTLEKEIDCEFNNKNLLKEALTHRSYLNEDPSSPVPHNERLEFLGDAVLELISTEELFNRYPEFTEGQLTPIRSALVNYQMMASVARSMDLERFLLLSRGEAKDMGRAREVILANALEAVIGAIYIDQGYESAKKFINRFIMVRLDDVMKQGLYRDAKSLLQEQVQERLKLTPTYRVMKETGPDHGKTFTVGVYFGEKFIAEGTGRSKQDAEVAAAKSALETFPEA